MSKIRTAVLGLNMGEHHAYAFHYSDNADLRYVIDLDEEKAKALAEKLGCGYTTDWTSVLDEIDAISICTPHHLHAPQSLQAIAAGKHVLLEKPLATTEEDCYKVIHAAEDAGVTLMMAYIVRFLPAVQRLKEIIDNEEYGKVFNANCRIEGYLPPSPNTWFASKEKLGGGVLFSHGCHYIDLLIWLLGKPVEYAALGTRLGTEWMEGEGTSHSIMKFESGALGYLETSWGMRFPSRPDLFHIHTTEATLILNGAVDQIELSTANGREVIFQTEHPIPPGPGSSAIYQIEHFLECIAEKKTPETDGRDAMKSLDAIWKLYDRMGKY